MRIIRCAIAVLIALALAVLPVSAAFAMQSTSKAEANMSAPADGCPCCDATHDQGATCDHAGSVCPLKCCGVAAILVESTVPVRLRSKSGADWVAGGFAPFTLPPDPPPPRS